MTKYTHTADDSWEWLRADLNDVTEMINLSNTHFKEEFENIIFTNNPTRFAYHLHTAIIDQTYETGTNFIATARDKSTGQMVSWYWCSKEFSPWSDDAILGVRIAHVDQTLSVRIRTMIIAQQIEQWISLATLHDMPVVCSTSIRPIQGGFLRLHEHYGFIVRGSYAYKRIAL